MSYRDDANALHERIDALERQVARVEQLEQRIQELEQENRGLRAAAAAARDADVQDAAVQATAGGGGEVYVDAKIHGYVEALLAATRAPAEHPGLEALAPHLLSGARPADGATVIDAARAHAVEAARPYVTPSDIRAVAPAILSHRVLLSERAAAAGVTVSAFIDKLFDVVEVP